MSFFYPSWEEKNVTQDVGDWKEEGEGERLEHRHILTQTTKTQTRVKTNNTTISFIKLNNNIIIIKKIFVP